MVLLPISSSPLMVMLKMILLTRYEKARRAG
jgi:hypothetical protein